MSLKIDCRTVEKWEVCVFPFKFEGKTYDGCTYHISKNGERDPKPWCSTKIDSNGEHVKSSRKGGKHFGHCSKNCPMAGW